MTETIRRKDGRLWDTCGIAHNGNLLCDILHPVGSLYFSFIDTNPGVFFGGKWQAVEDVFILTAGKKYKAGTTGGVDKCTLTIANLPEHDHEKIYNENDYERFSGYGFGNTHTGILYEGATTKNLNGILHTGKTGGNEPHENMPPYKVFYCWERIS